MPGTAEAHVCGIFHLPQTQPLIQSWAFYKLNIKHWSQLLCLALIRLSVYIKWDAPGPDVNSLIVHWHLPITFGDKAVATQTVETEKSLEFKPSS